LPKRLELHMAFQILISLTIFTAVFMLVLAGPEAFRRSVSHLRERGEASSRKELSELFIADWTPNMVTYVTVLAAVVVLGLMLWLSGSLIVSGLCAAAVGFVPGVVFKYLKEKRLEQFEGQLGDGLELLANAVKSGQTLAQALEVVASQTMPPLAQEFALMVQEYQVGSSLDQVLRNARDRLPSKNLALATAALLVGREKGGNLPETLGRIAESIREIHRLEEKIRTSTAEGRKSARTMAVMPFVLGSMLYVMDPGSFSLLFTDPIGNVILFLSVVLIVVAFLWIRRIVSVPI